jgi:tetratricopeptide (TPR) repeat protein
MVFGKGKSDDPVVLMQQGQYRDAIKLLQKKLRRNPSDLSTKIKLAEAFEGNGRIDRAAELYVSEAEACLSGGQRSKALALFKKAAKLQPDNESVKHHILQLESPTDRNDSEAFSFDIGGEQAPVQGSASANPEEAMEVEAEETPTAPDEAEKSAHDSAEPEAATEDPSAVDREATPNAPMPSSRVAPPELETTDSVMAPTAERVSGEATIESAPQDETPKETLEAEPVQAEVEERSVAIEDGAAHTQESGEVLEESSVRDLTMEGESLSGEAAGAPVIPSEAPPSAEQGESSTQDLPVGAAQLPPPEDFLPLIKAFFPDLEDRQAEFLNSLARPISLEAGEVLVSEEEEGDSLFIITRGRLEARGRFESGEYNLALLSAGDIIGEVAFLKRVPRTATVTAAERSLVLELPGEETRKQLEPHPELLAHLETILQERVEKTLYLLKAYDKGHHGDKTH